ncbi:MAG: P-loop NTPase fold protein [Phycisphaerales bacterium]
MGAEPNDSTHKVESHQGDLLVLYDRVSRVLRRLDPSKYSLSVRDSLARAIEPSNALEPAKAVAVVKGILSDLPETFDDEFTLGAISEVQFDSRRKVGAFIKQQLKHLKLSEGDLKDYLQSVGWVRTPISRLKSYECSLSTRRILDSAVILSTCREWHQPFSSSSLLFAMGDGGLPDSDQRSQTATFLARALASIEGGSKYAAIRMEYLTGRQSTAVEAPKRGEDVIEPRVLTRNAARILERAREIARQTEQASEIHVRHLLASMLEERPGAEAPTAHSHLRKIGFDLTQLRADFFRFLRTSNAAWKLILLGDIIDVRRLADYAADLGGGTDLIGIDPDVDAFATLIAAQNIVPPLSIGLFGDWGSGKTFFMRRLRGAVDNFARRAQTSGKMQRDLTFYKRIVQIEFNAWHYVEGNLWASLVQHIFENLRISGETSVSDKLREHLIQELCRNQRLMNEAKAEENAAWQRVHEAEKRLADARHRLAEKAKELASLSAKRELLGSFVAKIQPDVDKLLEELNLSPLSTAAGDMRSVLREARSTIQRGWTAITPLLYAKDRKRRWKMLLALAVAAPIVGLVLGSVPGLLGKEFLGKLTALSTGAATLLGGAVVWFREQAQWITSRVAQLEEVQRKYDMSVAQELAENTEQVTALEHELQALTLELETRQRDRSAAESRAADAEARLGRATTTSLLAGFIQDRAASSDYRRHLGVLAMVREDFERLSGLMEEENWRLAPPHPDDAMVRWKTQKYESLEEEEREGETRINRIVLYIDDLDRCPPHKVVQVLQAIHLLLAFPLFVVVVGVDARWVSRSLAAHYYRLLRQRDLKGTQLDDMQIFGKATASDYLEKIFQIPFWLTPMDSDSCVRMVQGLLKDSVDEMAASVQVASGPDRKLPEVHASRQTGQKKMAENEGAIPEHGRGTINKVHESGNTSLEDTMAMSAVKYDRPVAADLDPDRLRLQQVEVEFMGRLALLLGRSPRALKRFVNVYRLIKARLSTYDHMFFLSTTEVVSDYQAVLFLLAVDTGVPRISSAFFRSLQYHSKESHPANGDQPCNGGLAQNMRQLVQHLDGEGSLREQEDWSRLKAWLDAAEGSPGKTNIDCVDNIRVLAKWIPLVSRYSFRPILEFPSCG